MILADIYQLWSSAWPAGLTMLGLGGGFALVLLIASQKLKVEVDPKVEQIRQALPNLDCGACGFAGCGQYAKALLHDPELLGRCAPGGPAVSGKIAEILNLQVSEAGPQKRPVIRCHAHTDDKTVYARYQGIQSCIAANALANVQACAFGCLGFGDCVRACNFDALHMADGLAVVDYDKCTGCTACSKVCPRNLIEMIPFCYDSMIVVACNSRETPKSTRRNRHEQMPHQSHHLPRQKRLPLAARFILGDMPCIFSRTVGHHDLVLSLEDCQNGPIAGPGLCCPAALPVTP